MDHTHRLLISLDSLLDTRAGTLCLMDMNKTAELMNDLRYSCRIVDWFEGFDKEDFAKRYQERNEKTLSVSLLTRTYKILQDFLKKCHQRSLDTPHKLIPEIHVNFYPYQLSEQTERLILQGIKEKIPQAPTIKGVNFSNVALTPRLLLNNYKTVVSYDFLHWIEVHSENEAIKKCPVPGVTFFTPALMHRFDEKFPKDIEGFFTDLTAYFQFFAGVTFLPVDVFSSVLAVVPKPHNPKAEGMDDVTESKGFDVHWT